MTGPLVESVSLSKPWRGARVPLRAAPVAAVWPAALVPAALLAGRPARAREDEPDAALALRALEVRLADPLARFAAGWEALAACRGSSAEGAFARRAAPLDAPSRAAVRRALERCGRDRGRFASTPAPSRSRAGGVSRCVSSLIAHIIAHTEIERLLHLRSARATR